MEFDRKDVTVRYFTNEVIGTSWEHPYVGTFVHYPSGIWIEHKWLTFFEKEEGYRLLEEKVKEYEKTRI